MRALRRNQSRFYYALFRETVPIESEWGVPTGEFKVIHEKPKRGEANISAARGRMAMNLFGETEDYDRVMVLADPRTPIDEFAVLWVDTDPALNANGDATKPHDYIVSRVARSLNSVSIAIKKITVSQPPSAQG